MSIVPTSVRWGKDKHSHKKALGTDEAEEPISETLEEPADAELSAFERGVGELSVEALENMTLNAADVPEVISAQAIAEKDHVLRLREQKEKLIPYKKRATRRGRL